LSIQPTPTDPAARGGTTHAGRLALLDQWVEHHCWHPRILPFLVYVLVFGVIAFVRPHCPAAYPFLYVAQCGLVAWLMWRYRRLTPELNLRFHWMAIPVGVGVFTWWVLLGRATADWLSTYRPVMFPMPTESEDFRNPDQLGLVGGWITLGLRLVGMALVVPLMEEMFVRSLLLRSLHSFRRTAIGVLQVLQDLPALGEWFMLTKLGTRAARHPPVFGTEFERVPLGSLSVFGVAASTAVFAVSHQMRDRPAAVVCGVAYCLLLWCTQRGRKLGLGPVVWAHGITNALLWFYAAFGACFGFHRGWQFL
jgi:membrane protease YdiL (CAAX protease family)